MTRACSQFCNCCREIHGGHSSGVGCSFWTVKTLRKTKRQWETERGGIKSIIRMNVQGEYESGKERERKDNNCSEEKMGANECREWEKAASSGVVGNRTPLHWCCDRGWLATAQLLITNGALVNATTKVRQSHHNNSYAISLSLQYFSAKSLITKSFLVAAFAIVFLGTKESKS